MRKIVLSVNAGLTFALSYVDTSFIQNQITQALQNDGFNINNVSVSDTVNSFNIIIVCFVNDNYSDETTRLRVQKILSEIKTRNDYGIFTGNYYNLFSYVVAQIVEDSSIQTTISAQDLASQSSLIGLLGLKPEDVGLGLGLSTPVVVGFGVLLLVLYLRK